MFGSEGAGEVGREASLSKACRRLLTPGEGALSTCGGELDCITEIISG